MSFEFKPQELTYESKELKEARFAIFRLDFIGGYDSCRTNQKLQFFWVTLN